MTQNTRVFGMAKSEPRPKPIEMLWNDCERAILVKGPKSYSTEALNVEC